MLRGEMKELARRLKMELDDVKDTAPAPDGLFIKRTRLME